MSKNIQKAPTVWSKISPFAVEYITKAEAVLAQHCPQCGAKDLKVVKVAHAMTLRKILPLFPVRCSKRLFCSNCGYQQAAVAADVPKDAQFTSFWTLHKYMGIPLMALFFWVFLQWDRYDLRKALESLEKPQVGAYYIAYIASEKAYGVYRITRVEDGDISLELFDTAFERRADSKLKSGACIARSIKEHWLPIQGTFTQDELTNTGRDSDLRVAATFTCTR